jgi:hypothetical protein
MVSRRPSFVAPPKRFQSEDPLSEYETRAENRIEVPERIGRYHSLVREMRALFSSPLRGGRSGGPRANRFHSIDVSKGSLPRALKIVDTLIKALERRGHSVRMSADRPPKLLIGVDHVELSVLIEERYRRVRLAPTADEVDMERRYGWPPRARYDHEPTGELALRIDVSSWETPGAQKTWADGKTQRVEGLLNAFVLGLVRAAEAKRRHDLEVEKRQQRWAEDQRLAAEARLREMEENRRREGLFRQARAWAKHCQARAYVNAVRHHAERNGDLRQDSVLEAWLAWAESYLESSDPLHGAGELPSTEAEWPSLQLSSEEEQLPRTGERLKWRAEFAEAKAELNRRFGGGHT